MKKYATLISLSLMIVATCAFGMAPSLVLPGVKIQQNQTLTPSIDIGDYVFDWDAGATFTATGPENSGSLTVSMDGAGIITITETGQAVGYTEIRTFDVDDGSSATDEEGLLIEVIAGASYLDPDPIYGCDFDNDSEEWRGIDIYGFDTGTYAYDSGAGSYKVTVVGDSGDEYYCVMQATDTAMAAAGINVESGKVYEVAVTIAGSHAATSMPRVRYIAAGNRIESSYEEIIFCKGGADTASPGQAGRTYTSLFTPTLDPSAPSDSLLFRVDLIDFPGVSGHPVGSRTLHVNDATVSLKGSLAATTSYSEVASWDFATGDDGWTTASSNMRNQTPGSASFSATGGNYTISCTAAAGQGKIGMIQCPSQSSATMQGGKNYLVEVQMSGSEASVATAPRSRILLATDTIDVSSELCMFEQKLVQPTSAGNTTYYMIGNPIATPAGGLGTFVRIDLIHAGIMGSGAGVRSISVDKVAIYEM